jgi:hypothetical protein
VLTLPGALLPNIFWDELVEGAVAADHEHVVVERKVWYFMGGASVVL